MFRKPVTFYNQTYSNSESQQSIDQSSSAEYSYKNKSNGYSEKPINNNHGEDASYDMENNPTRRGMFNTSENYLVNETKVKRPVIHDGNSPYKMEANSYKLQRLAPYGSNERSLSRDNPQSNKSTTNLGNPISQNKLIHDLSKSIKPQHLVSFGNITNRNPSNHSSKKTNNPQNITEKYVDKQNFQPNSEDSYINDQLMRSATGINKNNVTKTSTNPSVKDHLLHKKQQQENDYLLPIVNTNTGNHSRQSSNSEIHNFHSNALSETSSINPQNDSRISQADQSAYLKQKLIETHSKLIKELEISKELEDNFFELKKKYEDVVALLNQQKSKQSEDFSQSKIKQLQQKQIILNNKNHMLTERVQELAQENKCLKEELTQMSQNMSELILDNQTQKQKQQSFKYSSNDLSQRINQQKAQFKEYLSQYNHQKVQYQEQINRQSMKIQELKNDLENMRNKVLTMITQSQSKKEEIQSFTEEKVFFQNQIKVLEDKILKKDKEFIDRSQLCEHWRTKCQKLQTQIEKSKESSIQLQKVTNETKNLNNQLNIALRQEKQKNAQMLSEIINIQMETKELKSKVSSLEDERKTLQDKLFQNTQQKNIIQQKLQLEHNIEKLTNQYNSLSAIINKKDKQINQLSNQVLEKNNLVHKMALRQKQMEIKERELEKRQRDLQDQKISRITSVKDFVNKLEEEKDRNVGMRRPIQNQNNCQMNQNQQNVIRQNVLNVSSSMRCESSGNTTPARQLSPLSHSNNKMPKNYNQTQNSFHQNENFDSECPRSIHQRPLTPSKSLSGLKVNLEVSKGQGQLGNRHNYQKPSQNDNKILICDNEEQMYEYQQYEECMPQNFEREEENNFVAQNGHSNNTGKYESVEDSLQLVRMINKVSHPQTKNQVNRVNTQGIQVNQDDRMGGKTMVSSKSAQQLHSNKQAHESLSQTKPANKKPSNTMTQEKQRKLSSYKEEKQQYMSLLQEIGELETQNYNLNQEKKKIVDELDKIESTKTKTKEMIVRRRQLQLWLLGNQKKNNEVKEKLKIYRGKVL